MNDYSTSVTFRKRHEYGVESFARANAWKTELAILLITGGAGLAALRVWGQNPLGRDALLSFTASVGVVLAVLALAYVFGFLRARCTRLEALVLELRDKVPRTGEWEGVGLGDRYFAWSGPGLYGLEEWDPVSVTPPGLSEALQTAGYKPSYTTPWNLEQSLGDGALQVFETDGLKWRREVRGQRGEQVLLVTKKPVAAAEELER